MAQHSSIVGGSTADRLLNCPGSYTATLALPPSANISSEFAEEGTAMHAVMQHILQARKDGVAIDVDDLIGTTFHDRALTVGHVDEMIIPALDALDDLEAHYGGGFTIHAIERSVRFPGVPGAFGTIDLVAVNATHVLHVDWKFGSGVGVKAVYARADGEVVNPQLLFYVTASLNTIRKIYTGRKLVVAIIQPRGNDPLTHTTVTRRELTQFREDIENAIVAAMDRKPPRHRGEHCRFAPCKVNCPLWTGPLLDLSALSDGKAGSELEVAIPPAGEVTPYGEYLARAKSLVDMVAMFKKTLDEQMHAYMEAGGTVPGWKLKAKAKQRQWIDEETVVNTLEDLGFTGDDIWQRKLQTFQRADAAAKRLGVKIPDELRVAPPTTETTMTTIDDPAPAVQPHVAVEQFSGALRMLQQSILPDGSVAPTPAATVSTKKEYLR